MHYFVQQCTDRVDAKIAIYQARVAIHNKMNIITTNIIRRSRSMPYKKQYAMRTLRYKIRDALRDTHYSMDWSFPIQNDVIDLLVWDNNVVVNGKVERIAACYSIPYFTYTQHQSDLCAGLAQNVAELSNATSEVRYWTHIRNLADTLVGLHKINYDLVNHADGSKESMHDVEGILASIIY